MAGTILESICAAVRVPPALSQEDHEEIVLAFEDTLAVALAGWSSPVVQACLTMQDADRRPSIDGGAIGDPERSAFINGVASHALDYDDVHLTSVTHPSAVLVPALLAVAGRYPHTRHRMKNAYAIGLAVNVALGEALGFQHYEAGWHATSTIGPLAGAAALAHQLALDEQATRSALALAAAHCGGLQRNFGSMAKPVQAGNAAAASVRSALLAQAGVTGEQDIFGAKGYFDLYGGRTVADRLSAVSLQPRIGSISRKLFPCCYAAHRLIAAAVAAGAQIASKSMLIGARVEVVVPSETMRPLRVGEPRNGAEAQFCAAYTVAVALMTGTVRLADFTDAAILRPEIRHLMASISLIEESVEGAPSVGLDHGSIRLKIFAGEDILACAEVHSFPGSPAARATAAQISAKIEDCLGVYRQSFSPGLSLERFRFLVRQEFAALPEEAFS